MVVGLFASFDRYRIILLDNLNDDTTTTMVTMKKKKKKKMMMMMMMMMTTTTTTTMMMINRSYRHETSKATDQPGDRTK